MSSRTDKERMDWLEDQFSRGGVVDFNTYGPGSAGAQLFTIPTQHTKGYLLRGAIDNAMTKTEAKTAEASAVIDQVKLKFIPAKSVEEEMKLANALLDFIGTLHFEPSEYEKLRFMARFWSKEEDHRKANLDMVDAYWALHDLVKTFNDPSATTKSQVSLP